MEFEWDERKAAANEEKHGVPFAFATRVFLDIDCLMNESAGRSENEQRFEVVGVIEKRVYVVIFTQRNGRMRIISARKGNDREKRKYHKI